MTFYYKTYSFPRGERGIPEETRTLWEHIAKKKNWRIVQLPNGFFQAEYKDPKDEKQRTWTYPDAWQKDEELANWWSKRSNMRLHTMIS